MPTYQIARPISSCEVNLEMLERIEKYVFGKAREMDSDDKRESAQFTIKIKDRHGVHSLSTFSEFGRPQFANDTKAVSLEYRNVSGTLVACEVRLEGAWDSDVVVRTSGPNCREMAQGIVGEVNHVFADKTNINFIFHGIFDVLNTVVLVVGLFAQVVGFLSGESINAGVYVFAGSVLVFLSLTWSALGGLSPYITFDTNRNGTLDDVRRWLIRTLLVGAALSAVFKYLLP